MLLEVKDLVVKYGEITAISGISLEAEEGQLTTLIGSNGAGKSTFLRLAAGSFRTDEASWRTDYFRRQRYHRSFL